MNAARSMRALSPQPNLVEQAHDAILDAICDGRLKPGARLTQEHVALLLQVSRQPVGQALALLKARGLVCDHGRRGLMVAPLDGDFVHALYDLRGAIERLAARRAAERTGPALAAKARRILADGRAAAAAGSLSGLIAADMAFHAMIYQASGNPVVVDSMRLHWHHIRRAMSAIVTLEDYSPARIWAEHEAIAAAIIAGDGDGAEALVAAHVADSSSALQAALTRLSAPEISARLVAPISDLSESEGVES